MASNTFKSHKGKSRSIFSKIESSLRAQGMLSDGVPIHLLPRILFVFVLLLLYIGNSHHAEKTVRKINRLETEVEDLRADYTTMKAEYMLSGKQSEVAQKVAPLGLKESLNPPYKLIVKE